MGPIPRFPTWDALNVWLTEQCRKRQADVLRGHSDSIGQRLGRDLEAMMNLPYAYYEQLNGYEHLKTLDIGYFLYTGSYADDILAVLKPSEKTILHIPSVDARESTGDKHKEVGHIIDALGKWQETDPVTCFHLVKTPEGQLIKIADLVDDDPTKRERVSKALKDPAQKKNRDHVDLIIALGMAKEGFDWIWREHALTVGYRASLTEIVQIIGRATRDAKGKTRSRFADRRLAQKADAFILSTRSNQRETLARFEHENEVVLTFNKHRSFEVIAAGEDECRSFLAEQEPQDGLDMANLLEFQPEEA